MFTRNYLKEINGKKLQTGNFFLKVIFIASIIFVVNGCSSTHQIISRWKSDDLIIDGDYSDWQNKLEYIKDENASVGFQNDKDYMYLCLIVDEPMKAIQMLRAGFIVWFIPDDESKIIGLKFPLGITNIGFDRQERRNFDKNDERRNIKNILERLLEKEKDFEIVDKSKYPLWMYPLENDKGIKIKISEKANKLVYELQIPISKKEGNDFYIPVKAAENLKITFETLVLEFSSERRENVRNIPQGGFQRPSGGMRRNMPAFAKIEPLNFSVKVILEKNSY